MKRFTLIELFVIMAIVSIILTIVLGVLGVGIYILTTHDNDGEATPIKYEEENVIISVDK